MRFKSIASWPPESGIGISEDEHDTREQAEAVCRMLARNGLGGQRVHFPIATTVKEVPELRSWENPAPKP